MERRLINVLQAGRALAALAVVAYHADEATATFTAGLPAPLHSVASHGYLGVDFFFVLSGFIISYTRTRDWRFYARSRLARIYLPYLPVGIGVALAYAMVPGMSATHANWDWLGTLTLFPGARPALIVAWTLQYEVLFYAVFGLGMVLGRPILTIASWCAVAILTTPLDIGLITIEFLFGVLAAKAVEENVLRRPLVWSVVPLGCFIALGATHEARTLFGLAMAFVIIALVRAEEEGRIGTSRVLLFLGSASYSIYLTHKPVVGLTARLFHDPAVAFAACILTGTLAGVAYHLLVEAPALRRFKAAPAAGLEGQEATA